VLALAQREFTQHFPQPGWVEHDPEELWQSQYQTALDALRSSGTDARDIAAIGITNQRETTLLWDRTTGTPVSNAIVWQDRRTASMCQELGGRGFAQSVTALSGLVLDPYFSATKLAWLLDRIEGARERATRGELAFGTVDTWLIWKLTGGQRHVTNASRTMLFDIHRLAWSDELLSIFNIPRALLPDVLPCTADFGTAQPELFGSPVRICGVAGDQQAALVGQAGFTRGLAKNTYGTGSFVMLNTGETLVRSAHGLLQSRIASELRLKRTPTLEFVYDSTTDRAVRVASLDVGDVVVREADRADEALLDKFAHRAPGLLQRNDIVRPMKEIQVDVVAPKPPQACVACRTHLFGAKARVAAVRRNLRRDVE